MIDLNWGDQSNYTVRHVFARCLILVVIGVSRENYNHFLGAPTLQLSSYALGMKKMGLFVNTFLQPLFKNEGLRVPGARNEVHQGRLSQALIT